MRRVETPGAACGPAGIDCFVVDQGDPDADSATPWLHGFPSSPLGWRGVVDRRPGQPAPTTSRAEAVKPGANGEFTSFT